MFDQEACFEDGLGELLDKERVSVGLRHDLFHDVGGQSAAAHDMSRYAFDALTIQSAQHQSADVGKRAPGRLELGSKRDECENRQLADPLDNEMKQLERGVVGPLNVFYQQQDRLAPRLVLELVKQGRKRAAALLRRAKPELWISVSERDRQQRRKERGHSLDVGRSRGEQHLQLVEAYLGRVVHLEPGSSLQLLDERTQCTPGVVGRALVLKPVMRLDANLGRQRGGKPGLADPRLARDQDDLAVALPGEALALTQKAHLGVAIHKVGKTG